MTCIAKTGLVVANGFDAQVQYRLTSGGGGFFGPEDPEEIYGKATCGSTVRTAWDKWFLASVHAWGSRVIVVFLFAVRYIYRHRSLNVVGLGGRRMIRGGDCFTTRTTV